MREQRNTNLQIENALINLGEQTRITATVRACDVENANLTAHIRYLEDGPSHKNLSLPVQWDRQGDTVTGTAEFTPPEPGNYYIELNTGDDSIFRYMAVVTNEYSVVNLNLNGVRRGAENYSSFTHGHFLPMIYYTNGPLDGYEEEYIGPLRNFQKKYGAEITPLFKTDDTLGLTDRFSLWELTEEETIEAFQKIRQRFSSLGLEPPDVFNIHWCAGNVTATAARKAGVKVLSNMVGNYYMRDGESREILTGMPLRPYFLSTDDFRKAGSKGKDALLGMIFSVVIPTNFHQGNPDAHLAPDVQMVWDRSVESGPQAWRSKEVFDQMCAMPHQNIANFFSVSLQNFGPKNITENNFNTLEFLLDKAKSSKLVFANCMATWNYYTSHFDTIPESTWYVRDFYVGYNLADKPIHHPDVIQIQNEHLHAAFNRDNPVADYFYDYTRKWDYPDEIFKDFTRFGPEPEKLDKTSIDIDKQTGENEVTYTVTIKSNKSYDYFPIALWDIPVVPEKEKITCDNCRFVNTENQLEGSSHGVLIGAVKAGTTKWVATISGRKVTVVPHLRNFDNIVGLKTIPNIGGIPYTYIWSELKQPTLVALKTPADRNVRVEFYDRASINNADGNSRFEFTLEHPRPFARIWNVRADEIEIDNLDQIRILAIKNFEKTLQAWPLDEISSEYTSTLEAAKQEVLSYRDTLDSNEMISKIMPLNLKYQNKVIAETWPDMIKQRRQWFRQTKAIGPETKVLLEAHAYCKDRVATPWRDKADFHHVIDCADGVNFEVTVYDYVTCWEPGYSAWHMGRMFWTKFNGLDKFNDGKLQIHVHAYDYDRLGRCYTAFFSVPETGDDIWRLYRPSSGKHSWPVPQGRDKRDAPESIYTITVPDTFRKAPSFRLWLKEGYEAGNIDMKKQTPYSVIVSDVWVTHTP